MAWPNFEPLKVTAYLRTGVISDCWLPLDSILYYQGNRMKFGAQVITNPGGPSLVRSPRFYNMEELPLQIVHPNTKERYYACSFAQPQPWWVAEGTDHWNKRFDAGLAYLIDFQGRRGKVTIGRGRYRAYHMPVFYRVARRITWYCVGDAEAIRGLLSTLPHVGKKAAQGWGCVIKWEVEPWLKDWSVWGPDGRLMRAVPRADVTGRGTFDYMYYGLRPSYYQAKNQMLLARPKRR